MKYYTIFLGEELWEDVIDDMCSTEVWAQGGMLWDSKRKAMLCMNNLKDYDFETDKSKFSIKRVEIK